VRVPTLRDASLRDAPQGEVIVEMLDSIHSRPEKLQARASPLVAHQLERLAARVVNGLLLPLRQDFRGGPAIGAPSLSPVAAQPPGSPRRSGIHVSPGHVVATGVGATVKDFAEASFARVGLNWQDHIEVDQKYIRPTEVDALIGDPSKAANELDWKAKTHWKELAEIMVDADLRTYSK
jgi:hypothetical protein